MIIKLNTDGSITIAPQACPESLDAIYLSYIFPKGLNHLQPVLNWGGEIFEGHSKFIKKKNYNFHMKVTLYAEGELVKTYKQSVQPSLYVGYHIEKIQPNIVQRMRELELEVIELKERGDII